MFGHVLLKFPPGVFNYLAVVMTTGVTFVLLLVGFAGNVRVKHVKASIFRTLELSSHSMLM